MGLETRDRNIDEGFFALAVAPFKRYFEFSGRSRRKEYFYFHIFVFIVAFCIGIFACFTGADAQKITGLLELGALIPSIAVSVRRMHDTNYSGWWIFIPIANIIFLFLEGHIGPNQFGADPKHVVDRHSLLTHR
jgi:uncharacterized membrane protein YhaH (DUF805 family)